MLHPDPVRPPWAPVLAIRVIASCWVVHVTEVPGEFTSGKAAQIKPPPHEVVENFPPTHWANFCETHAFCPSTQKSINLRRSQVWETRRLTGAARVFGELSKLSIQLLSILSVLELEVPPLRVSGIRSGRRRRVFGSGCARLSRHSRACDRRGTRAVAVAVAAVAAAAAATTTTGAGVLSDIDELLTIRNGAIRIGRAGTGRAQGRRLAEGDRSRASNLDAPDEGIGLGASELALEQSRQFRVLWRLLAVLDALRTRLTTALRKTIAGEWGKRDRPCCAAAG